jgi:hypothetical protein
MDIVGAMSYDSTIKYAYKLSRNNYHLRDQGWLPKADRLHGILDGVRFGGSDGVRQAQEWGHSTSANASWLWMHSWFSAWTRNQATLESSRRMRAAFRTMSSTKAGFS